MALPAATDGHFEIVRRPVLRFILLGPMVVLAPMAVDLAWTTPDAIATLPPFLVASHVVGCVPAATAGFLFVLLAQRHGHRFVRYRRVGALLLGAAAGTMAGLVVAAVVFGLVGRGFSVEGAALTFLLTTWCTVSGAACGFASLARRKPLDPIPQRGS